MNESTSDKMCYPFKMDQQFIECAEAKLGIGYRPINEPGLVPCCTYEFVERIVNNFNDFIASYLREDKASITCNTTQDDFAAPLFFELTNDSCSYFNNTDENIIYDPRCVHKFLEAGLQSSFYGECYQELKQGLSVYKNISAVITVLIIVFGLVLNSSLLLVYCKQRSLWKPLNLYIFSTILADTLMLLIVQPIHLIDLLTEEWRLGDLGCQIYNSNSLFYLIVISYMSTALSIERYHMIANCFQSHTADVDSTKRRVVGVNLAVWIFAISLSIPSYFTSYVREAAGCIYLDNTSTLYWFSLLVSQVVFVFVVPFSLIAIFYIMTFFKITKKIVQSASMSKNDEIKSREKTARIFLVITAVFFVCHLPFNILMVKVMTMTEWTPWQQFWQGEALYIMFYTLGVINFCSNSAIMFVMSTEIRSYVYKLFSLKTKVAEATSTSTMNTISSQVNLSSSRGS